MSKPPANEILTTTQLTDLVNYVAELRKAPIGAWVISSWLTRERIVVQHWCERQLQEAKILVPRAETGRPLGSRHLPRVLDRFVPAWRRPALEEGQRFGN
jgi:hypothetical protein